MTSNYVPHKSRRLLRTKNTLTRPIGETRTPQARQVSTIEPIWNLSVSIIEALSMETKRLRLLTPIPVNRAFWAVILDNSY